MLFVLVIATLWHPVTVAVFTAGGAALAFWRGRRRPAPLGRSAARYAGGVVGGYLLGIGVSLWYASLTGERFGWLQ